MNRHARFTRPARVALLANILLVPATLMTLAACSRTESGGSSTAATSYEIPASCKGLTDAARQQYVSAELERRKKPAGTKPGGSSTSGTQVALDGQYRTQTTDGSDSGLGKLIDGLDGSTATPGSTEGGTPASNTEEGKAAQADEQQTKGEQCANEHIAKAESMRTDTTAPLTCAQIIPNCPEPKASTLKRGDAIKGSGTHAPADVYAKAGITQSAEAKNAAMNDALIAAGKKNDAPVGCPQTAGSTVNQSNFKIGAPAGCPAPTTAAQPTEKSDASAKTTTPVEPAANPVVPPAM